MTLTKEEKRDAIGKHGRNESDTGSTEVQVAMLTRRINQLEPLHVKVNAVAEMAGQVADEIVNYASTHNVSLIAMSTRPVRLRRTPRTTIRRIPSTMRQRK